MVGSFAVASMEQVSGQRWQKHQPGAGNQA